MAPNKVIEHNVFAGEQASRAKLTDFLKRKNKAELIELYAAAKVLKEQLNSEVNRDGVVDNVQDKKLNPADDVRINFMLLLSEAVMRDQNSMSKQELIDAKTTEIDTKIEGEVYKYWYAAGSGILSQDQKAVQTEIDKHKKNDKEVGVLSGQYRADSQRASAATSQADGLVQSSQGQASSDATNLQLKTQMLQAVVQVQNGLAALLQQLPGV